MVNCGNGAAGPTFDAIAEALKVEGVPLEIIRVHHEPDYTFPNGIPNPLLVENRPATSKVIIREEADLGVAFDGDFDRCFLFDETGGFIGGEYVLGLLATSFLDKNPGSNIIHDPRVIWNIQDIVQSKGGKAIQSKTGHAFIKQSMRKYEAIYGGEMSAHHYFRDFAYCDSGMIPWLLIIELLSTTGLSLSALVKSQFEAFPSSGENNFTVENADAAIQTVLQKYKLSGSVTNWLAIHMLFEKVPLLYGSGIIPNKFEEFKMGIKSLVMEEFFNQENITLFLKQTEEKSRESIYSKIDYDVIFENLSDAIMTSQFSSMLGMFGGKKALEPLREPIIDKLSEITQQIIEAPNNNLSSSNIEEFKNQIETILNNRLKDLTPVQVKKIIQDIIQSHLGWLVVWGGLLGGVIGFSLSLIQSL